MAFFKKKDPLVILYEKYPVEWIKVKGYKTVRQDLTAWYNKNYKYEIEKENMAEGELEMCKNGLHFCSDIKCLADYCSILDSRIFEVEAVIDANYAARYYANKQIKHHADILTKMVAKSMILVRELTPKEIWDHFSEKIKKESFFETVNNFEDYICYRFKTLKEVHDILIKESIKKLVGVGYSEAYSMLISEKIFSIKTEEETRSVNGVFYTVPKTFSYINKELLNFAIAYAEEGLSPDMRAYLLSEKLK